MADDNKNENEEQDDFFGDDEDFGLPDLDYEALEETSTDDPLDEEVKIDEPVAEEPAVEEPSPSSDDDGGLDLGMDLDSEFDTDALGSDTDSLSDDSDDFGDDMYSDDDFGDFDAGDIELDEEVPDSVFDSDVMDDDEFKDFETETTAAASTGSTFSNEEANASRGKFIKIVVFGTIIFAVLGFSFWYFYSGDDPKEVARKETPKKAPAKKPAAKKPAAKKPASQPAAKPAASSQASQTASSRPQQTQQQSASQPAVTSNPGSINTLSDRTGNSFIIVGSFVDSDIANDFATELAASGKSPTIIPPFGNGLFTRVAIAGYPTVASAMQNLDSFKGDYGDDVWVLKY